MVCTKSANSLSTSETLDPGTVFSPARHTHTERERENKLTELDLPLSGVHQVSKQPLHQWQGFYTQGLSVAQLVQTLSQRRELLLSCSRRYRTHLGNFTARKHRVQCLSSPLNRLLEEKETDHLIHSLGFHYLYFSLVVDTVIRRQASGINQKTGFAAAPLPGLQSNTSKSLFKFDRHIFVKCAKFVSPRRLQINP